MKQSRMMSFLEAALSTMAGFGISLTAQVLVLPLLGVTASLSQNFAFALVMTVISIARQFVLRRIFEALHIRRPLSPFVQAVIAERVRQIEVEGWDAAHDNTHAPGELSIAGAAYARSAHNHLSGRTVSIHNIATWWPWDAVWWKPTGFRRDLVKAAALIIAEGEKFDRCRKPKSA